jgi:hypothetical protein
MLLTFFQTNEDSIDNAKDYREYESTVGIYGHYLKTNETEKTSKVLPLDTDSAI